MEKRCETCLLCAEELEKQNLICECTGEAVEYDGSCDGWEGVDQ